MSNEGNDTAATKTETETVTVSKADLEALINRSVNSAVTSHLKRQEKKAVSSPSEIEDEGPKAPAGQQDEYAKKLAKLEAKLADSEKKQKDLRVRNGQEGAVNKLTSLFNGKLKAEAISIAIDLLRGRNAIQVSDDGEASFMLNGETVSLEEGALSFLSSKDASLFKSPPEANPGNRSKTPIADHQTGTRERDLSRLADIGIHLK